MAGLDPEVLGRVCGGVEAGLEALSSVGLIETGDDAVTVHPLVAETIRHRLAPEDARRLASVAVDLLDEATAVFEQSLRESSEYVTA